MGCSRWGDFLQDEPDGREEEIPRQIPGEKLCCNSGGAAVPCYQQLRWDAVAASEVQSIRQHNLQRHNITMKIAATLILATALAPGLTAGPLQSSHVPENAKWLIHLDVEKLMTTQLGGYVGRTLIDKKLAKPTRDLEQWGIDFDWRDVESLTVFGSDFTRNPEQSAVLLVQGAFDFAEAIEVVLDRIAAYGGDEQPIEKLQTSPFPIYSAKNEVFGAPYGKGLFLLSKSRAKLELARQVLESKAPSVAKSKRFPNLATANDEFLVAAVADGFQSAAKLPPQIGGLKNAESGQIKACEKADKVCIKLSLNTRDAESATRMQQVLQGLVALATLSQEANRDLATLAEGAKVSGADKTVSLDLEVPSQTIIARVSEKQPKRRK